jgi:hypothetical protein
MTKRILFFLAVAASVFGADEHKHRDRISIHFENDLFVATDRYYTNGVQIRWLSRDLETAQLPAWALEAKDAFALLRRPGFTHNVGFAIGQSILTPRDLDVTVPDPDDHPYAAWLYGSLSLHHKKPTEAHTLELTLGIVGPAALGEEAQNGIHNLRDLPEARGWDYQLDNEPGIILTYQQKRRFTWRPPANPFGWGFDCIPELSFSAGNVLTRSTLGCTVRFGWNLPQDFHDTRIRTAGSAPLADGQNPDKSKWSLYSFWGVEGQAVAHNIFLDGNTFQGDPSVDREPWVAELHAGIGVRWHRVSLVWTSVFRTEEFEEQEDGHQFGSLTLSWDY